jgi:hypothetical protein
MRKALALGVRTSVHVNEALAGDRWTDLMGAADVVVPSAAAGAITLLDVLAAGRPVVAPIDPLAVQLIVPASVGLVYRHGDVSGTARALLGLLVSPTLRTGMDPCAREVAKPCHLKQIPPQHAEHRRGSATTA